MEGKSHRYLPALLGIFTIMLVGCGGGSDTTEPEDDPSELNETLSDTTTPPPTKNLQGVLVVPEELQQATTRALTRNTRANNACPTVPSGYMPLQNAEIDFLDENRNVINSGAAFTNNCGEFNIEAPDETAFIQARSVDYRDLISPAENFIASNSTPRVASTIASDAEYEIILLSEAGTNKITFAVSDTRSGRAVIGLPQNAISAQLNNAPVSVELSSAMALAPDESTILVLDASGSMDDEIVFTDPSSGKSYDRFQITSLASHQFLDLKDANSEVGITVFSQSINFLDETSVNDLFSTTLNGTPSPIPYPVDGFSKNATPLRFAIDAYNPHSALYGGVDEIHQDVPEYTVTSRYPWRSNTSLYDAIYEGIDIICSRTNPRRFVIAMTDGQDTSSRLYNAQDVIDHALSCNVPIYSVGFGASSDAQLENIAESTGASFYVATDIDLTNAFQNIQTTIVHQYFGTLGQSLSCGYELTVSVALNGLTTSRTIRDANTCPISVPNTPPSVNIDSPANSEGFMVGDSISFESTSSDSDGIINSYLWDFGNGNTASSEDTTFTYVVPGTHTISLTVMDDDGAESSVSVEIEVDSVNGELAGSVIDVVSREGIESVIIEAYKNGQLVGDARSGTDGNYSFSLPSNTGYEIRFSKAGYQTTSINDVEVSPNGLDYLETVLQIDNSFSGTGEAQGIITDATTGSGLSGVSLTLRSGINARSGTALATTTTDVGGIYNVSNLPTGHYTAELSLAGYNNSYITVTILGGQSVDNQNGTISPEISGDGLRIVLTWGASPQDLDSHLTGPADTLGSRFHVYFGDRTHSGTTLEAGLDADDTSAYGPETITLYTQRDGVYRYSVYDFENQGNSSATALSHSSAKVQVYDDNTLIRTFNIPTNRTGTLWTVFELDRGIITPVNTLEFHSGGSSTVRSLRNGVSRYQNDGDLISQLPPK